MIRSYFFKILRSPIFYLSFFAVTAVSLYSMFFGVHTFADILSEIDYLISFEFFRKMLVLLSALPFASNFANEWNTKTITNCVTRKNVVKYSSDNAVVCFITAFAVVFSGIMLSVLIRIPFKPLFSGNPVPPYGVFSQNGFPFLTAVLIVCVYALSCAMWSVMALAVTAFFPSKYIAVCAPFVLSYLIERFTKFVPGEFQLGALSQSWSGWNPIPAFFKAIAVFLMISLICTIIFTVKVKVMVENELP